MKTKRLVVKDGKLCFIITDMGIDQELINLSFSDQYIASEFFVSGKREIIANYIMGETSDSWIVVAPLSLHCSLRKEISSQVSELITYERFVKEENEDSNYMFLYSSHQFTNSNSKRSKAILKLSKISTKRLILI